MISDIVCEYLVTRKLNPPEIVKVVGVGVAGVLLTWFLRSLGVVIDRTGMMAVLLTLCGLALTIYLVRLAAMVEYEYSIVNGELTIDRILAKSRRKTMLEIDVKTFEKFGKYDAETVGKLGAGKLRDYSADKSDPNTYYAFYKDEKTNVGTVLLFTINEKMLNALKSSVSATVYRDAFRQ